MSFPSPHYILKFINLNESNRKKQQHGRKGAAQKGKIDYVKDCTQYKPTNTNLNFTHINIILHKVSLNCNYFGLIFIFSLNKPLLFLTTLFLNTVIFHPLHWSSNNSSFRRHVLLSNLTANLEFELQVYLSFYYVKNIYNKIVLNSSVDILLKYILNFLY